MTTQRFKTAIIQFCFLLPVLLSLQSCSVLRASPSKKNLFLTHPEKVVELRDRAPFNGVAYLNPVKVDEMHASCKKIVILPIRTDLLEKEMEREIPDEKLRSQRMEEAQEIARYFYDRLRTAITEYKDYPYQLLDKPEPDSFVVEFALVELDPTSISINVLGAVAGFFVPGGGLIGRAASGSIAFEAQIRDGSTNEILIEFRDREADKTAPFTIKDFQEYAHIRKVVEEWADQYAELSATSRTHRVSDSLPFTLSPI
jgi:hypothetical protein